MRLIDADALKDIICNNVYPVRDDFNNGDYGMFWTGGIEKAIDDAPTVDAVPVVRCKDCVMYSSRYSGWHCYLDGRQTQENDFCSWGERREDG